MRGHTPPLKLQAHRGIQENSSEICKAVFAINSVLRLQLSSQEGWTCACFTQLTANTLINKSFMMISPDSSLLRVPPNALLKLVKLRFSTADLLFLEHYGHLLRRDPDIFPIREANKS